MPVGLVEDADGETLVYPVDKGSGATTSLVDADGTVAIQPDTAALPAGQSVEVTLFSSDVGVPGLLGVGEDDPLWSRLLDLDFVPLGTERVRVVANPNRTGKESVERLRCALDEIGDRVTTRTISRSKIEENHSSSGHLSGTMPIEPTAFHSVERLPGV